MAKRPSLTTLSSGYLSTTAINQNFETIAQHFDQFLSRTGETPNSMAADLDMDSNDILNVDNLTVNGSIVYQGQVLDPSGGGGGSNPGVVVKDEGSTEGFATSIDFVGDGVTASVSGGEATITISGGGVGPTWEQTGINNWTIFTGIGIPGWTLQSGGTWRPNYNAGQEASGQIGTPDQPVSNMYADAVTLEATDGNGEYPLTVTQDKTLLLDGEPVGFFHKPENLFVRVGFRTELDNTVTISTSPDARNWSTLNAEVLDVNGQPLSIRDPAITYFNNHFMIFGTGGAIGSHEFVVFVSEDLNGPYEKFQISMAGGPYMSDTVPMPGGTAPANSFWAPEPFVDDDGTLHVFLSIRYGADRTDSYGNTIRSFRTFRTQLTDFDTLAFSAPVLVDHGATYNAMTLIDMQVIQVGSTYWAVLKDDVDKNLLIFSATDVTGSWTYEQIIDVPVLSIEGPSLVPYGVRNLNDDTVRTRFMCHVDYNRRGRSASDADAVVGLPLLFRTPQQDPGAVWLGPEPVFMDHPARHGTVINLASFPAEATQKVVAASSTANQRDFLYIIDLEDGVQNLYPRQNVCYRVDGTKSAVVNIGEASSTDQFYFMVQSADPSCGITVNNTSYVGGPFTLGYNVGNDRWYTMKRLSTAGQFYLGGNEAEGTGGGGSLTVQDEGTPLATAATTLNFTGAGVTASGTGSTKTINIPGGGGGLSSWEEDVDGNFVPITSGESLGNNSQQVREIVLEGRQAAGTAGSSALALFKTQGDVLRLTTPGVTNNNEGIVVGSKVAVERVSATSGSVVYDRNQGPVVEVENALTGTMTINLGSVTTGEMLSYVFNDVSAETVTFTPPSGSITWVGGNSPSGTETGIYVATFIRVDAGFMLGVWVPAS